jgi:hypothetical protein
MDGSELVDENAFGVLASYFEAEDDEYGLERERFVERFTLFREVVLTCVEAMPLGTGTWVVSFGHAVYFEVAEGDQTEDPVVWGKAVRSKLTGRGFESAVVVSHGSRWVSGGDPPAPSVRSAGGATLCDLSRPSEPLRRALYADTATRPDEDVDDPGWGPGVYVDTEAIEALGKKLKNAPTPLRSGGATYYRVAR